MRYYVVFPDGRRFGPADYEVLKRWVAEGRIAPDTFLEDETTGERKTAGEVLGMFEPTPPPYSHKFSAPPPPGSEPAATAQHDLDGSRELTWSYVCTFGSLVLCCLFPGAVAGIVFGAQAKKKRNPKADVAIVFAVIVALIEALFWAYYLTSVLVGGDPLAPLTLD